MGKFEKAIYIFWGIAIPALIVFCFFNADGEGKMRMIMGVALTASFVVFPFLKAMLILVEQSTCYNDIGGIAMLIFAAIRDVSLVSFYIFTSLIITKFAGVHVVQKLLSFDIFNSSIYNSFLEFLSHYTKDFQMFDFHRTFSWLISILPKPDTVFFYVLAIITFILFILGFLLVETAITKRKNNLSGMIFNYIVYGTLNLLVDHILVFLVIYSLIAIVPIVIVFIFILGNITPEPTPTVESFIGDEDSSQTSYFPEFLYSSSDNKKTLYYVSSSYSDRATYHDDNGNYIEIIERDGNYYDSSTRERYY